MMAWRKEGKAEACWFVVAGQNWRSAIREVSEAQRKAARKAAW